MTRLKSAIVSFVLIFGSTLAFAQKSTEVAETTPPVTTTNYTFTEVNFPNDTFTQLLGINKAGEIAGYHGSGLDAANPNQGFVLIITNGNLAFSTMNYPKSVQTQVIGINDSGHTSGFYVDANNVTHGWFQHDNVFSTETYPFTTFNQLLSANNNDQSAGYYQDSKGNFHPYVWNRSSPFLALILFNSVSAQATGINNAGAVSGFFIDPEGVNHGFLFINGKYVLLNYPGATLTQALGVNDSNYVVGTYTDASMNSHGFVYNYATNKYQSIDDPNGVGTTVVNGINDSGTLVGFWGNTAAGISHGFVATVEP